MSSHGFHPFGGRVSRHFGEHLAPDDAYLSYHDVRLTRDDVDSIRADWLTDNAISFYEEYLEREKLSAYPSANINLLRPSMAFMLVQTPHPHTIKDALPDFSRSTHIFLPVNDCRNPNQAEGGSHWSLLLVSILDGIAFHYDSLNPANVQVAYECCQKFSTLLGRGFRFINLDDTPRQSNGSDCGVYVCLTMKHLLLKRLLLRDASAKVNMSMKGFEVDASRGRKDIVKMIESFRREGKRSQSRSPSRDGLSPPRVGD